MTNQIDEKLTYTTGLQEPQGGLFVLFFSAS